MRISMWLGLLAIAGCKGTEGENKGPGGEGHGQPGTEKPPGQGPENEPGKPGDDGGVPTPLRNEFVYVMTNGAIDNQIVALRQRDNDLEYVGSTSTEAKGLGKVELPLLEEGDGVDPLKSQGSLTRMDDFLLAVNAGSGSVSALHVADDGTVELKDTFDVGGYPTTIVGIRDRVFVGLAAGPEADGAGIAQLRLDRDGAFHKEGEVLPLTRPDGHPSQVMVTGDGSFLVATEVMDDRINVWPLDLEGKPGTMAQSPSAAKGPFGAVALGPDRLLVADSMGNARSSVSSYQIADDAKLEPISSAVANGQMGTCWLAVNKDKKLAFSSNTASKTLTSYAIDTDGKVTVLERAMDTLLSPPIDLSLNEAGDRLYVLIADGGVARYDVADDGAVTPRGIATEVMLPKGGSQGIVAW